MGSTRHVSGRSAPPPGPDGVRSVDELVVRLNELRVWAGLSYREVHRRVARSRRERGIPEVPAYNTVYRMLQPGRSRLDMDLVGETAQVLLGDETRAAAWREACRAVAVAGIDNPGSAAVVTAAEALPEDIPEFTGRGAELQRILDVVGRDRAAVVSAVEGMAGVGKTTLAVHAAHHLCRQGHFPDGVLSVNLRGFDPELPPSEPEVVLGAFLRHLGEPGERVHSLDLADRVTRYRELMAGKRALVLLDNASDVEQVRLLLPGNTDCVTLVTSRRTLADLPDARHITLDAFTPSEALDYLRTTVGKARISAEPRAAEQIAALVGYLPLALGLIARRIIASPEWTLEDHRERLADRRETLRLDDGVELALDLSVTGLPAGHQRMFRMLALHPCRDIDAFAAAALAGTESEPARQYLSDLASGHLLRERSPGRYEFHDLVRVQAIARGKDTEPASARRAALVRLADYLRYTASVAMDLYSPGDRARRPRVSEPDTPTPDLSMPMAATAWLESERPNLIAIAVLAAENGWHSHTADLSAILHRFLGTTAHHRDAETLHTNAARTPDLMARGRALANLGSVFWRTGRNELAQDNLEQALALHRESGDRDSEGRTLGHLGNLFERWGRYTDSRDHYERSVACFQEIGDRQGMGVSLVNLGVIHERLAHYEDAIERYQQALVILHELGDRVGEGRVLSNIGTANIQLGHYEAGLAYLEESRSIAVESGDRRGELCVLIDQGLAHLEQGAPEKTLELCGSAVLAAEELREPYEQARAHDAIARASLAMNDPDSARTQWHRALRLHTELGAPEAEAIANRLRELDTSAGVA